MTYTGDITIYIVQPNIENDYSIVNGNFDCSHCRNITTLKGSPKVVNGNYDCCVCDSIETLEGSPEIVNGKFDCSCCNNIETLDGAPKVVVSKFNCSWCNSLKSLKGAPKIVEGEFDCHWCENLETVEGAPKKCKIFDCRKCTKLKNLDPLLLCDIEEVKADKHLLEDYYKKKAAVEKYGYDKAMEIFEVMENLL